MGCQCFVTVEILYTSQVLSRWCVSQMSSLQPAQITPQPASADPTVARASEPKALLPPLILNDINLGAECQAQQRWRLQTQHPQRSFAELVVKNMGALEKGESQRSKLRFICELETRIKIGTKPDGADSPSQLCLSN